MWRIRNIMFFVYLKRKYMHSKNKVYIHIACVRKEKTVMITICRNSSCHPHIYYTKTLPIIYYGGNESLRMVTFFYTRVPL